MSALGSHFTLAEMVMLEWARVGATVVVSFAGDGQSRVAKVATAIIPTTNRSIFFHAQEAGIGPSGAFSSIARVSCLARGSVKVATAVVRQSKIRFGVYSYCRGQD